MAYGCRRSLEIGRTVPTPLHGVLSIRRVAENEPSTHGCTCQRRVVPRTGRILILTSPVGFEGFFRELAEADRAGAIGPDTYARVFEHHGITWLT